MNNNLKDVGKYGYHIIENNTDFRKQDSILYRGLDGFNKSVLTVKQGDRIVSIIAVGDIYINSKKKSFSYRHDRDNGELTYHLRKYGDWVNNNWFEVIDTDELDGMNNPVSYYLNDAIEDLIGVIDKI